MCVSPDEMNQKELKSHIKLYKRYAEEYDSPGDPYYKNRVKEFKKLLKERKAKDEEGEMIKLSARHPVRV